MHKQADLGTQDVPICEVTLKSGTLLTPQEMAHQGVQSEAKKQGILP